jgi:hypothetical protein
MNPCKYITDAALLHLQGINALFIMGCDRITEAAVEKLRSEGAYVLR